MKETFIAVRDVDEEVFRKFKARSVEAEMKLGKTLTLAMKCWLNDQKSKKTPEAHKSPKLKPFDWGLKTEKTSKEVDEVLYN